VVPRDSRVCLGRRQRGTLNRVYRVVASVEPSEVEGLTAQLGRHLKFVHLSKLRDFSEKSNFFFFDL